MIKNDSHRAGVVKSLGRVFGDIETSPIYTLSVVFLLTRPTTGARHRCPFSHRLDPGNPYGIKGTPFGFSDYRGTI